MLVASVLKKLIWAFRYPSFPTVLVGPYSEIGAIQTRLPGSVACQIHYPAASSSGKDGKTDFHPYFRPEAVRGVAEYSRVDAALMEFLSNRRHPCRIDADPLLLPDRSERDRTDPGKDTEKKFPVVIFSHGLGGCYEMYTQLCMQIASQGYCVVALEHEDGSGCYARTSEGETVGYERPDDAPYSREKVTTFRRAFLRKRAEETRGAMRYLRSASAEGGCCPEGTDEKLRKILRAVDASDGFHLLGHSFGGASMIVSCRENRPGEEESCGVPGSPSSKREADATVTSLSLLDPWAFSLEDEVLGEGARGTPTLSILSESWLTNPETARVREFLGNTAGIGGRVVSLYAPGSVHASFADSVSWLPGFILRKLHLRGENERRNDTIESVALACVRHVREAMEGGGGSADAPISDDVGRFRPLEPYPIAAGSGESCNPELEPHKEPVDAY